MEDQCHINLFDKRTLSVDKRALSNSMMWISVINLLYQPIMWVICDKPILSKWQSRFIVDSIALWNTCGKSLPYTMSKTPQIPLIKYFCWWLPGGTFRCLLLKIDKKLHCYTKNRQKNYIAVIKLRVAASLKSKADVLYGLWLLWKRKMEVVS